jgi:hypothetical protein
MWKAASIGTTLRILQVLTEPWAGNDTIPPGNLSGKTRDALTVCIPADALMKPGPIFARRAFARMQFVSFLPFGIQRDLLDPGVVQAALR